MSKRILVIDDDAAVRKAFALALDDTSYEVVTAEGGEEGLRKLGEAAFDLVYLDLRMPGMDGVTTLRAIRKGDADLPVYIVTAFHREFFDDLTEVRKEGIAFELLRKPIEREHIIRITRGILEGAEILEGD